MSIEYKVIISGILEHKEAIKVKTKELRTEILEKFARYIKNETDETIEQLAYGGTYRGITWEPFELQYTRKDGTEVPAWGGVKYVKGRKKVKGQQRGDYKKYRVKSDSKLLQNKGDLKKLAASNKIIDYDARTMRINSGSLGKGGKRSSYFARQQSIRPYIKLTSEDLAEYRSFVLRTYPEVFR